MPLSIAPGASTAVTATSSNTPVKAVLRTAIPLGDSITQGSSALSADGVWVWSNTQSDRAIWRAGLKMVWNAGIASQISSQIMARLQTDVIAHKPDVCIILSGTNDMLVNTYGTIAGVSWFNYVEQMVFYCLKAGILPVLISPPSKNTTQDGTIADVRSYRYMYYMLAEYYGIPLVDYMNIQADPTTGTYITGYSADGIHPTGAAIDLMATQIANVLKAPYTSASRVQHLGVYNETAVGATSNMVFNGCFMNLTGSTPASSPLGWTLSTNTSLGTYSYTATTTYPYNGNVLKYIATSATFTGIAVGTNISASSTTFEPGDTIYFGCHITQSGMGAYTSGDGLYINISTDNDTFGLQSMPYNEDFVVGYEFVIPAGATYLALAFYCNQIGTYQISNVTFVNVSAHKRLWTPGAQNLT